MLHKAFYLLSVREPGCLWGRGNYRVMGHYRFYRLVLSACMFVMVSVHFFAQHTLWLKENKMIEGEDVSSGNHAHLHHIS